MLCVFFFVGSRLYLKACWVSERIQYARVCVGVFVCACMNWLACFIWFFFSSVGLAIVFHKRFYLIFPFVETWNCIQICGNSVARYLSTLQLKKNCIKSRAQTISVRRNSPIRVRNCIVVVVVELFWRCMKMTNKKFICI